LKIGLRKLSDSDVRTASTGLNCGQPGAHVTKHRQARNLLAKCRNARPSIEGYSALFDDPERRVDLCSTTIISGLGRWSVTLRAQPPTAMGCKNWRVCWRPDDQGTSMYESLFGLTGLPFQLSPDTSFLFDGKAHREALLSLQEGLANGADLMVLSGEIGAGKTTLLRTLLQQVNPNAFEVVQVAGAHLSAETLSEMLLIALGTPRTEDPAKRREALIFRLTSGPRPTLLVIDEAQHLTDSGFELLLALMDASNAALMGTRLCLFGQPELRVLIDAPAQGRFRQRVTLDHHLGLLDLVETRVYIEHRLRKVGWNGTPEFAADAFGEIFARTAGVPRRLNLLCNRLMLGAYLGPKRRIDVAAVALTATALQAEFELAPAAPVRTVPADGLPRTPGPLLCVVGGQSDHLQMAMLLREIRFHPALPSARLVRAFRNNAFALNHDLFDWPGSEPVAPVCLDVAPVPYEQRNVELARLFAPIVERLQPSAVVVCNGSDAALAVARFASQRGVPVFHLGAGQRSSSRSTPEDMTRSEVDRLSDLLFTSEPESTPGLVAEGVSPERILCVGNLAMDALRAAVRTLGPGDGGPARRLVPPAFWADPHGYGVVGLSKGGNIQYRHQLQGMLSLLVTVSRDLPLVWPVNNLTHQFAEAFELSQLIEGENIACVPMQAHASLIDLMRNATCVLTDSWSMHDEAVGLGVPCLMLGEHTGRSGSALPGSTARIGTSHLAANRAIWEIVYGGGWMPTLPLTWDGRTATRIAAHLSREWRRWSRVANVVSPQHRADL
jgi:general secretion pathway protein A